MVVEFSPLMYTVEEGQMANMSVVLVGSSSIEVQVTFNTQDLSANGTVAARGTSLLKVY